MCTFMCEYMCVHECSREGLKDASKLMKTTREVQKQLCQLEEDAVEIAIAKALGWGASALATKK